MRNKEKIYRYFSSREAVSICDVTYRRIDTWIRNELIQASKRASNGKGSRRLFTFADLVEIRVLRSLTAQGVKLQSLKTSIARLRKLMPDSHGDLLTSARLISNGKKVFRILEDGHWESLDECGQFAFAFGIGEEVAQLVKAVRKQERPIRYVKRERTSKVSTG
jgi:DNA-binding transcriptional MerR regulator